MMTSKMPFLFQSQKGRAHLESALRTEFLLTFIERKKVLPCEELPLSQGSKQASLKLSAWCPCPASNWSEAVCGSTESFLCCIYGCYQAVSWLLVWLDSPLCTWSKSYISQAEFKWAVLPDHAVWHTDVPGLSSKGDRKESWFYSTEG